MNHSRAEVANERVFDRVHKPVTIEAGADPASAGDTIFAIATGAGPGGIAIVRISGPEAGTLLDQLTQPRPAPRQASLRTLRSQDGEALDHAIVLWFPGPRSYTSEDCVELHLHAGLAVVDGVLEALQAAGGRPAGPGEFTQRAFVHGRIDLIQAEGLADLIQAETGAQRRQALAQSCGVLSDLYARWSSTLRRLVSLQEASIDFPDETDGAPDPWLDADIDVLVKDFRTHLDEGRRGSSLRRGLTIALSGWPNVGKSSLVNALYGQNVAIVSARAGTTRDTIGIRMVLGGVPVTLVDTAGIRESEDEIEIEGVRRAQKAAAEAEIVLRVMCHGINGPAANPEQVTINVDNKIDLSAARPGVIGVSAKTGEGLEVLRDALAAAVGDLTAATSLPPMTRPRQRDCIERSLHHLLAARTSSLSELRGEELRLAMRELGRLTGAVGVEDILSDIFSTFCIGK